MLKQTYVVTSLPKKLGLVYSFVKSHLKAKSIIFFSSCKQVRYADMLFRKFRPGVSVMCLHGKIKQKRRNYIYSDFIAKKSAVLFATDIAARGLDFPAVDWVVQADCPEDAAAYIHRVGRTARYKSKGNSLLILLPSEVKGMLGALEKAKVGEVKKVRLNNVHQENIQTKVQSELMQDSELKMVAQKAFKSYVRSVYLQSNKDIFDPE